MSELSLTPAWAGRRLHFVGIGGAGMSGLALIAHQLGADVTGSDRASSDNDDALRAAGIEPLLGHHADHVPDGAELVYSTAIPADNPERAVVRERGQRELRRGELLGELSRLRSTIAIAGTHGKTTTASMLAHALRGAGEPAGYVIGGDPGFGDGANADWGEGNWLVVEADESDRSLLALAPDIAVLMNVELDHHTTFGSRADLDATFRDFLALAPEAVIWDRPELLALRDGEAVPFDVSELELADGGAHFVWRDLAVELAVPGRHNALNAVAALEAARLAGVDPAAAAGALRDFTGAGRRFELLGHSAAGAAVYDDYAHHPTELRATLEAARTLGAERVVAVFQPHLYSRTQAFAAEFGAALALADVALVLPVYAARERAADYPGVDGELIATAAGAQQADSFDAAAAILDETLTAGDVCLVVGAGDVRRLGLALVV